MSIPKKIHYCWFGGKDKPDKIKKYINTWGKMKDYEIIEWNEENFDIESSEFVKLAYENKRWAFVSDYVRLKVLSEYGGIYLDTDVEIKQSFDSLLENEMFLGFIYDYSLGTAVIASIPQNNIINQLLEIYDKSQFVILDNKVKIKFYGFENYKTNNNNDLFTIYFLKRVNGFVLSNKIQRLKNVTIYPKEYFERKTYNKKIDYSIHHCYGSWYKDNPNSRSKIAIIVNKCLGDILYDKLQCYIKRKKLPYYKYKE